MQQSGWGPSVSGVAIDKEVAQMSSKEDVRKLREDINRVLAQLLDANLSDIDMQSRKQLFKNFQNINPQWLNNLLHKCLEVNEERVVVVCSEKLQDFFNYIKSVNQRAEKDRIKKEQESKRSLQVFTYITGIQIDESNTEFVSDYFGKYLYALKETDQTLLKEQLVVAGESLKVDYDCAAIQDQHLKLLFWKLHLFKVGKLSPFEYVAEDPATNGTCHTQQATPEQLQSSPPRPVFLRDTSAPSTPDNMFFQTCSHTSPGSALIKSISRRKVEPPVDSAWFQKDLFAAVLSAQERFGIPVVSVNFYLSKSPILQDILKKAVVGEGNTTVSVIDIDLLRMYEGKLEVVESKKQIDISNQLGDVIYKEGVTFLKFMKVLEIIRNEVDKGNYLLLMELYVKYLPYQQQKLHEYDRSPKALLKLVTALYDNINSWYIRIGDRNFSDNAEVVGACTRLQELSDQVLAKKVEFNTNASARDNAHDIGEFSKDAFLAQGVAPCSVCSNARHKPVSRKLTI